VIKALLTHVVVFEKEKENKKKTLFCIQFSLEIKRMHEARIKLFVAV